MNILTFNPGELVSVILVSAFIITVWLAKLLVLKKLNFIDITLSIIILIIYLFGKVNPIFTIILIVVDSLVLLASLTSFVLYIETSKEINDKTVDYIKNTEYDFFIQMNEKEKIIDCSTSLLKLTKLSKKEVINNHGWKFIFDSFDVKTLNKEEFTLNYVAEFLKEFKECNSKHRKYKFQMEVELKNTNDEIEVVKYDAIVQPVFFGKFLVARNIYFYQDKLSVIEKLKETVRSACNDLDDAYLQLDVMMSLSEGVIMYYDFQSRLYVATECMRLYTHTNKKEYEFEELFSNIHPDDVQSYINQAETVNSLSVTKIKYRLMIGDVYYQVEEDSIYMKKDYGLISILRIAEKSVKQSAPQNAKIRDDVAAINSLAGEKIIDKLNKTNDILNIVLGDNNEEK